MMENMNRYGWHVFERRHELIAWGWRAAHDKFASLEHLSSDRKSF